MITNPHMKYKQTSVQTASGPQLLLMLYDGAIKFVRLGIEGINQRDLEKTNTNLLKAQHILNELIAALNFDYELSHNLLQIYEYMIHELIQANVKKSDVPAQNVLEHLLDLKETWYMASKSMT
jgi:flagellar protein FliS